LLKEARKRLEEREDRRDRMDTLTEELNQYCEEDNDDDETEAERPADAVLQ
jgi:hypothetical protein